MIIFKLRLGSFRIALILAMVNDLKFKIGKMTVRWNSNGPCSVQTGVSSMGVTSLEYVKLPEADGLHEMANLEQELHALLDRYLGGVSVPTA